VTRSNLVSGFRDQTSCRVTDRQFPHVAQGFAQGVVSFRVLNPPVGDTIRRTNGVNVQDKLFGLAEAEYVLMMILKLLLVRPRERVRLVTYKHILKIPSVLGETGESFRQLEGKKMKRPVLLQGFHYNPKRTVLPRTTPYLRENRDQVVEVLI